MRVVYIILLASGIALSACTSSVSTQTGTEAKTDLEIQKNAKPPLLQWFADPEDDTAAKDLHDSYEAASAVRDIMLILIEDLEPRARNAIAPVLQSFSDNLDALNFYVELADREPLSETENQAVAELTADIDEAMLLFGQVLKLLL